ncbi:104aa long hypothetical protein [Pyrococcus horikoshii OT3]|uniref:Uncharacterized protein n=1 Tax=Pyrococcus horikoshii (strain ATCC 700860 / DSM 12428 / JCM 9974 / NBRC 100139 / OT-3) TaxID=70601 RepID=O58503_PYRHO|nr:104aa long hypothetical protein [Pyrococcus horikoshii OT3]
MFLSILAGVSNTISLFSRKWRGIISPQVSGNLEYLPLALAKFISTIGNLPLASLNIFSANILSVLYSLSLGTCTSLKGSQGIRYSVIIIPSLSLILTLCGLINT